ncbi:cytochrome P450 [Streptomyces sp. NPDC048161]|uniref:cytochrome P450 n=1 Tax=Streptomyces sp. NPDC048161 TaxID=3160985 RepID=UPI00340B9783
MTEQSAPDRAAPADRTLPIPRVCPFSPPPEYAELREKEPVSKLHLPNKDEAWVLTRYEDVRAVLTDPRFSSDVRLPGYPFFTPERPNEQPIQLLIHMDPPTHGEARRKVISEYTAKRTRDLRPRIQRIVDERLDAILRGPRPVDLVAEFAVPVPALVMFEQLGIPRADHAWFLSTNSLLISGLTSESDRDEAFGALSGYLMDLIEKKEAEPGDDLLSRQIAKNKESGTYDRTWLTGLALLLFIGGSENMTGMISLGTMALLRHPEQRARIAADPSLTPQAVEEMLRCFTIAELTMTRVATEDVEVGGKVIHAGEGLVALTNAADHDPAAFPDPDVFDIDRPARSHLAFGFGAHQCLGQSLARLEFQVIFDSLCARLPGMELAVPFGELKYKSDDEGVFGLVELPVTW